MLNVIIFVNVLMEVMKLTVPVIHHYILDVEIPIVYHPGDNVMELMIAMTCRMKKAVQVALEIMNLDAKKVANAFQEIKLVIGELTAEMDPMNLDAHIGKLVVG